MQHDPTWVQVIGWVASAITVASAIPQLVRLLVTRNTHGVNTWSYVIWLTAAIWWTTFGLEIGAAPSVATNVAVFVPLAVLVLVLRPRSVHLWFMAGNVVLVSLFVVAEPHWTALPGSVLLVVFAYPSARESLRRDEDLSGVALGTWVLTIFGSTVWQVYDAAIRYPATGLAGDIMSVLSLVVIVRVVLYRRRAGGLGEPLGHRLDDGGELGEQHQTGAERHRPQKDERRHIPEGVGSDRT
jgi:uncharacterized protein with PQ loop repeat